jgi:2-C-methyl-D-erythritol 4-phosphate cytidylyltransferase
VRLGLVVVAAGSSRRMSGEDKVWALLGQHPVLWYSVASLAPLCDEAVLVVREDRLEDARALLEHNASRVQIVAGGAERQASVARGLAMLGGVDLVAVHDAARPLVPRTLLETAVSVLKESAGCIPASPLYDTVKLVDVHDVIRETIDRAPLRAAQTPQVFRTDVLRHVHDMAVREQRQGTDDAGLVEAAGYTVKVFPGSPRNFKITTAFDLEVARLIVESGR